MRLWQNDDLIGITFIAILPTTDELFVFHLLNLAN